MQLQRVITGERLPGWHSADDLVAAGRLQRGDHVIEPASGWVGVVEEVFEMAMIEAGNAGIVRRVCDTGTTLSVGSATEAIKQMLEERGEGLLAQFLGATDLRTILDVKQCMIAVNWLCRNQQAPPGGSWDRPRRYWVELDQLVLARAAADRLHTIHDKVAFADPARFPPGSSRWSDAYPEGHRVLTITATKTDATVLWQDGTTTTGPTPQFEQVPAVDEETDVFPGDVGVFSGVSPPRIGVVQSMDARRRTIRLRYLSARGEPLEGEHEEETVSGLEFDPHGPPPDAYGVRRGDIVLVTREGDDNGAQVPVVPSLGESEVAAGLMPSGEELRMEVCRRAFPPSLSLPSTTQLTEPSPRAHTHTPTHPHTAVDPGPDVLPDPVRHLHASQAPVVARRPRAHHVVRRSVGPPHGRARARPLPRRRTRRLACVPARAAR